MRRGWAALPTILATAAVCLAGAGGPVHRFELSVDAPEVRVAFGIEDRETLLTAARERDLAVYLFIIYPDRAEIPSNEPAMIVSALVGELLEGYSYESTTSDVVSDGQGGEMEYLVHRFGVDVEVQDARRRAFLAEVSEAFQGRVEAMGGRAREVSSSDDTRILSVRGAGKDARQILREVAGGAVLDFHLSSGQFDVTTGAERRPPEGIPATDVRWEETGEGTRGWIVDGEPILDVQDVFEAFTSGDPAGHPYLAVNFTPDGSERFCDVTAANIGRKLIVSHGEEVLIAPVIDEPICGGRSRITVPGSPMEAYREMRGVLEAMDERLLGFPVRVRVLD